MTRLMAGTSGQDRSRLPQRGGDATPIPPAVSGPLRHRPFQRLENLLIVRTATSPATPTTTPTSGRPHPPVETLQPEDDRELFAAAMAQVRPLNREVGRIPRGQPMIQPRPAEGYSEDEAVLAHLTALVSGQAPFDLTDSDEYIEGVVRGLDPGIVAKLRLGCFSVQAYLDLHGLTVAEAEQAVTHFINRAVCLGHSCVLLIHGRGLNSKDQVPILKKKMETILLRGRARKHILAFTSARPHDGGAGASYVLLGPRLVPILARRAARLNRRPRQPEK